MVFRQSFNNHIKVSGFTWFITTIFWAGWWFSNYDMDFLLTAGIFHIIFTLPALYLHIDYSIRNAGEEIVISHNKIIIRKNGNEKSYHTDDLLKVVMYKPASLDKGGIPFSAMEYYRFARIFTKSGEEIVITCLMTLDIEGAVKMLSGIEYERRKVIAFLFCK